MTGLGFNARRRAVTTVITALALVAGTAATVLAFDDVPPGAFFEDAVAWTDDQDIANGRPTGLFDPYADVTRGELVTMFWRLAGRPDADPPSFSDIPSGAFFETPVGWAEDIGLTTGTAPGVFSPFAGTKRSEVVTFLWRYVCRPAEASAHGFTDVVAGSFYEAAVKWAKVEGVTTGNTPTTFNPNGTTNRAEAATFIWRLAGQPSPSDPGSNRTTGLPHCVDNEPPSDPDEGTAGAPGYTAVGNTQLRVTGGTAAASGLASTTTTTNLLDGATDPDMPPQTLSVHADTGTSANGGEFEVFADGTFTYVSAAGFTGVDSFGYLVCDDSLSPECDSSTAYLTVADTVFYVDEDSGSDTTGDGTSVAPFASLAPLSTGGSADSIDGPGDTIYVADSADGTVSAGIVLEDEQSLIGEGVDLVVGATTLIAAGSNPTIKSTASTCAVAPCPGIKLGLDNTVRGVDVDTTGGPYPGISGSSTGDLVISDVDTVSSDVDWAVTLTGTGSPDVTIGHANSTSSGGVKLFNHRANSSFTFTQVTSGGSAKHGVNIFGFGQPGSTIDLGTLALAKTGAGNDGIHIVNSPGAVVSTTGGTIASQGVGVYVENAGAVINGLTIDGDPAGEEGNQRGGHRHRPGRGHDHRQHHRDGNPHQCDLRRAARQRERRRRGPVHRRHRQHVRRRLGGRPDRRRRRHPRHRPGRRARDGDRQRRRRQSRRRAHRHHRVRRLRLTRLSPSPRPAEGHRRGVVRRRRTLTSIRTISSARSSGAMIGLLYTTYSLATRVAR